MSPKLEQLVLCSAVGVLVALFTWIYVRNREQRVGLWILGWVAILIHFAVGLMASFSLLGPKWTDFVTGATLQIAGVSFVLSVSRVRTSRRRALYFLFLAIPAIAYAAFSTWASQEKWILATLVIGGTFALLAQAWRYYSPKSLSFYVLVVAPGTYAIWSAVKAMSNPWYGSMYFLTTFYVVAGFLYFQYYNKRVSPGVFTTSVSFFLWGAVFPVATILDFYHAGPGGDSVLWSLPKFLVAFGMIMTLFENEAVAATRAARQYRSLFEGNLASVYLSTIEGRLLDCNTAFVKMYGYASKEEILACHAQDLYLQPQDREEFLNRVRLEGTLINYERRQRKKDGAQFWTLERATSYTNESGEMLIEGTSIDITERKHAELALRESEERFATIFHHSPVACGIVSLEGVFMNGNAALAKQLGRPIEQIVGKTGVQMGLWKSQEERDQFYSRLRAEGSLSNMDIEFIDASGNKHAGVYYGSLVRIADQECIFGMQLDFTEQRELEAKFLQSQKMEAVGRLAGGVAHDFNNLLGVIGSFAELLELRLAREASLRTYCSKILETTRRGASLTRQLLTFSRKEISNPVPLEPNRNIRELVVILSRLIGEDIEIILDLQSTGDIVIDKTHFEQIIFNIVVNARDAMPGGGELIITTKDRFGAEASSNGRSSRHLEIAIRDTGCGMDETTRLRAFEPFFTTKEKGQGTGLGLSTVYGIVQERGGEINIESRPNEGTQITISLPAMEHVVPAEEKEMSMEPLRGIGHILLVEDEAELRNANTEFLTSIGYSVTCAGSGLEALDLLDHIKPIDLVITDVVMPKMSGPEFAGRLLQLRPGAKLLFVSGYADDVLLKSGLSANSSAHYLQKPYTLRQLGAKIREVLAADVPERVDGD